ncbi:MAG TPA: DUF5916 domain-containing protein [Thermoanaerobaculia bacterium]|nr:DUF5916 domain-containing protein [Thermoanaerobaculia bacterium]
MTGKLRQEPLRYNLPIFFSLIFSALPALAQPPQGMPPQGMAPLPPRPSLAALAITEPIKMDGLLDDEAWQRADVGGNFTQYQPNPGQPATEKTEVRVVYTPSALYVGIRALTSDPRLVIGNEMQRDGALFRDDSVLVLLDTFNDDRNAFFFEVNPNGAFTDALVTDEGRDFNVQWDAVWRAVAKRTPEGWSAELEIPFATLRFDPAKDTWGLNVRRLIRHKNEEVYWASIPLQANLFRVSLAGDLTGIHGPEPGLNLRIKPFVVGSASQFQTPTGRDSEEDGDVGLDVKWGLTRTMTLDLTYNTDFAEAEVDDQQVNLTRFSLFFPEKRDFFLENYGLFEFGFGSPGIPYLKPFFSRRIGISPFGTEVPIDWGARLTGRSGPWSLGLLDAQTGTYDLPPFGEQPKDNWGVVRVKRNLGRRSNVGFIATNRDQDIVGTNRVYGVDGDFKPNQNTTVSAFYTRSETESRFIPQGVGDDWAGGAQAIWQGPTRTFAFDFLQIGEQYNPESGFLLRSNVRRYIPRFSLAPRPATQGKIRNYNFGFTGDIITDLDNKTQTIELAANLFGVTLQSGDQFILFADHALDRVPAPFRVGDVIVLPDEYEYNDAGLSFATNNARRFSLSGFALAGTYYGGDRVSSSINLGIRASKYVRSDTTWDYNDIKLPGGTFKASIVRQRLGLSFSPTLFANTYLQYNDAAELVSLNLRFNWLYRPGADLFIVFNQNWNAPSLGNLKEGDRQIIVKFTYLFEL